MRINQFLPIIFISSLNVKCSPLHNQHLKSQRKVFHSQNQYLLLNIFLLSFSPSFFLTLSHTLSSSTSLYDMCDGDDDTWQNVIYPLTDVSHGFTQKQAQYYQEMSTIYCWVSIFFINSRIWFFEFLWDGGQKNINISMKMYKWVLFWRINVKSNWMQVQNCPKISSPESCQWILPLPFCFLPLHHLLVSEKSIRMERNILICGLKRSQNTPFFFFHLHSLTFFHV